MRDSSGFWDKIAERYASKPVADQAAYERKLAVTREHLRPDMRLLEFGCGTGSTALLHAPHVAHIRAVDFSGKMLEIARSKAQAQGIANVAFERAAIEDLTAPDESYDGILGLSILHLLADRDAVLAKVHRLLKPGGVFVSSTVCIGDMAAIFRVIVPLGRAVGLVPQLCIFTLADLRESLIRAGFALEHEWQPGKNKGVFIVARKGMAVEERAAQVASRG